MQSFLGHDVELPEPRQGAAPAGASGYFFARLDASASLFQTGNGHNRRNQSGP